MRKSFFSVRNYLKAPNKSRTSGTNYPTFYTQVAFVCTHGDTNPDPSLCEVSPHGYLLPCAHVRVAIPLESGFQFLQLLAGEVSPLPPLALLFGGIVWGVIVFILDLFFFCEENSWISQGWADWGLHAWERGKIPGCAPWLVNGWAVKSPKVQVRKKETKKKIIIFSTRWLLVI